MHQPLSQRLLQIIEANSGTEGITLNDLLERTEGRGFYLVIILLALPFIVPVSIPGVSTVLGLSVALLSLKLAFGTQPRLPNFMGNRRLSPEVQRAFGGFAGWRKGYAQTVSHAPGGVTVTAEGASATVGLTLRAGDRGGCGETVERRFAVTWRLARTEAGWRATAASARKISGPEPC